MSIFAKHFLFSTLLIAASTGHAEQTLSARALTEKMIEKLGGQQAWARLSNTVNGSIQNRAEAPTEVYSVITMDFESPRFKIETTAPDVYLVRVIDKQNSWRISWAGDVEDLPEASFNADMLWYQAHIYKTIHRLAKRDKNLSVKKLDDRLEVHEAGTRLLWFKLDAQAEPYAFGFRDDNTGSLCGPWTVEAQGVKHPRWVSHADGKWRAAIKHLQFNIPLHPTLFSRPGKTDLKQANRLL